VAADFASSWASVAGGELLERRWVPAGGDCHEPLRLSRVAKNRRVTMTAPSTLDRAEAKDRACDPSAGALVLCSKRRRFNVRPLGGAAVEPGHIPSLSDL
jgi:hypothetical protein